MKAGNLPAYSFIEPRMVFNHNDMHPPFGTLREGEYEGEKVFNSALSDVRAGEALLHSVYDSLRGATSAKGSNAMNTALFVTFDEHGGTYDHVPPPSAVPPEPSAPAGEMGFTFDRLGCRVPAILVSAYTAQNTIIHDEMHHGALAATLNRLHGLEPLTRRDATANNVFNAVNLNAPRQPYTWPVTHPAYVPPNPEDVPAPHEEHKHRPLSTPAQGLLGILLAKYEPNLPVPKTYGEAYDVLVKHGKGLFGDRDSPSRSFCSGCLSKYPTSIGHVALSFSPRDRMSSSAPCSSRDARPRPSQPGNTSVWRMSRAPSRSRYWLKPTSSSSTVIS